MNKKLGELGKISKKEELVHLNNFNRNYNLFKSEFSKLKKKETDNHLRLNLFSDLKEKDKLDQSEHEIEMDILTKERNSLSFSHSHADNFIEFAPSFFFSPFLNNYSYYLI